MSERRRKAKRSEIVRKYIKNVRANLSVPEHSHGRSRNVEADQEGVHLVTQGMKSVLLFVPEGKKG